MFGRPWPVVHPDDHLVPVFPRADRERHDAVRHGIRLARHAKAEWTEHQVGRAPAGALPLDHGLLRFVVRQGPRAGLVGEGKPEVVHGHRIVLDVFGPQGRPRAGKLELRRRPARCKHDEQKCTERAAGYQVEEHGVGSHLEPSGSFLKCGLTMYGPVRYSGSSTIVVTSRSRPASATPGAPVPRSASGATSKCSVTVARSPYGTPFFRR